ncbi:WD repeat-containing protein 53-like [Corticium candelabrum]|uniref:WD repeat-containing protein 53-like n=1 Tax=Corticium candelabrum TaxID=121492 RepID=UPI002E2726E1|nr:WD repeat-containing protein 53-like [Corticium candelabrum]
MAHGGLANLSSVWKSHVDSVNSIGVSSCGVVASCGDDGVFVWSDCGIHQQTFRHQPEPYTAVCFSQSDPNLLLKWSENEDEINDVAVSPSGQHVASCDDSGEIKIYDIRQKRLYRTLHRCHTNICSSASFHPQRDHHVVSGGLDSCLVVWDVPRAKALDRLTLMNSSNKGQFVNPPLVHSVAFNQSGDTIASALGNGVVTLHYWQGKQGLSHLYDLAAHTHSVSQVVSLPFTERGHLYVSGGNDGKICIWDVTGIILLARQSTRNYLTLRTSPAKQAGKKKKKKKVKEQDQPKTNGKGIAVADGSDCEGTADYLVQTIDHGSKINWLASGTVAGANVLLVADQTADISVYQFA